MLRDVLLFTTSIQLCFLETIVELHLTTSDIADIQNQPKSNTNRQPITPTDIHLKHAELPRCHGFRGTAVQSFLRRCDTFRPYCSTKRQDCACPQDCALSPVRVLHQAPHRTVPGRLATRSSCCKQWLMQATGERRQRSRSTRR
jgi:hypothetical protein